MNLKKLFLPDEINNYYLFTKRILGIDIGKSQVHITQILLSGRFTTVEKTITETIEPGTNNNSDRTAAALKKAIAQCDAHHEIRTSLSSAHIVFKELRLPFASRAKIEKVVSFEVEPLLPFPVADAAIDFIVTASDQEQSSAQVLVAATQKQYIAQHLQIFEQAGIKTATILVDLFAIYGAYLASPKLSSHEGTIAFVDIGFNSTRIACIANKQLRSIRTINKGIATIARAISDATTSTPAQALENLIRFGLRETDNPTYHKALQAALAQLVSEINFTFASFAFQMKRSPGIDATYILGGGAQMRGIQEFLSASLATTITQLNSELFADIPGTTFKDNLVIDSDSILSFATALPTASMADFNLLPEELSEEQQGLLNKQILVAIFLSIGFLVMITTYTFVLTNKASNAVESAQKTAVDALKEQLPEIKTDRLDDALKDADEEVTKEEKTWFAFSNRVRSSYLKYLLELTNRMDKQTIGLELERINMSENTIVLKGHVANFDAFRNLRKALRESDLFGQPEAKEELDFTMTIPIISTEEE